MSSIWTENVQNSPRPLYALGGILQSADGTAAVKALSPSVFSILIDEDFNKTSEAKTISAELPDLK